ncbi:hypothetical protein APSETT444_000121 [Aspergillus pseudonomiae]
MKTLLLSIFAIGSLALATPAACSPEKALVRKEWRELGCAERKDYIDALWCLRHRPSILPIEEFPGVRNRWDDFVAYWNWPLDTDNLLESPVFDGSDTSLSGNGAFDPNEPMPCSPSGTCLPRGTGGGCVESGPFKDLVVHMGPFSPTLARSYAPIPDNAYDYNPRCLSRSLSPAVLGMLNNQARVDRMQASTTIRDWLAVMSPSESDQAGSHGGGHRSVGGSMADFFASPQDPSFMLHHAFIDRLWAQWQDQDPVNRRNALNGTTVIYDPPGAPFVRLDTLVEFGQLSRPRKNK